jgi:hypothetical protein
MAAGLGFKDFVTGEVLTAADVDGYLMQGIWVFASAAVRDAAVTSPQEGNACYLKDTNQVLTYSGSAWVAVGGGSPLTTKGDLYGFSTVDARIPIGANDTVLTADSTQALGLKWAAPSSGGMTLLSTTSLSGASTTVSSISGSYTNLQIFIEDYYASGNIDFFFYFNSDTTAGNYITTGTKLFGATPTAQDVAANDTPFAYWGVTSSQNDNFTSITVFDYASTTHKKLSNVQTIAIDNTYAVVQGTTTGWKNTSAITEITVKPASGTFSAGTMKIYGVK